MQPTAAQEILTEDGKSCNSYHCAAAVWRAILLDSAAARLHIAAFLSNS